MTAAMIRAEGLTKLYGRARGVLDLDLEVRAGEIFGFLGPNGAGKTTTIRLLLDFIRPTGGGVRVLGLDPRRDGVEIRRRVGYVPGDVRLDERLTPRELCTYFAHLRGGRGLERFPALAARLDLELDRPIRALSRGNRQKVALVQALMHGPELLVLDEPTSGLDPLVQQTVAGLLREVADAGGAVFLSSHVLSEVQQTADRVALVREGRLVVVDTVEGLRGRAFTRVEALFEAEPPADAFRGVPGVRELARRGAAVSFALEGEFDPLLKALARYRVLALESREADLEDVFLALYGERDAA